MEEIIPNTAETNPSTSSRAVAPTLSVSRASVLKALREYGMHPYQLQRLQAMTLIIIFQAPTLLVGSYSRLQPFNHFLQMFNLLMRLPLGGRVNLIPIICNCELIVTSMAQ